MSHGTYPDLADDDAYEAALGTLADLTDTLLDTVKAMDDAAVTVPSSCAGWTRGHVLAHVARNADAFGRLLQWARTGVETPMYASREARDAEIEAGAARSASEQEADVDSSGERLLAAVADLPLDRRHVQVRGGNGAPMPAHDVLWGRIREVALHHVDLDTGYRVTDLPGWVVARGLVEAAERMTAGGGPGITAEATDTGQRVRVSGGGLVVRGAAGDLLGWLSGRGGTSALQVEGTDDLARADGSALPVLPAWG